MRRSAAPSGLDLVVRPSWVEASLWRRLRLKQEFECRERLFDRYARFARLIAGRFFGRRYASRIDRGDFEQFAFEGLLQAIDGFDPMTGVPFAGYAKRRIAGNISDGIARMSEIDAQMSQRHRIEQERLRSLARKGEAAPGDSLGMLADLAVGLALGFILEGTGIMASDDTPDEGLNPYERLEWREMQVRLVREVAKLPEKEAVVVRQHYDNGLSFALIAQLLALTRGRVSQLHRSALERLRRRLGRFE